MKKIYWYAPMLRPPSFCTMPKGDFVAVQRTFPGYTFPAWAYNYELSAEDINHLSLKLVIVEVWAGA